MENLVEGKFGTGAFPHTEDPRDYKYTELAKASAPFDWAQGIDIQPVKVKNQGSSSSCGGQAWAYFMGVLKGDERSARFIYSQTAVPGGGSDGRTNCDLVVKQGDCQESILSSYENGNPPTEAYMTRRGDISLEADLDASTDQALSYAQVDLNFDSIAQAIRDNKGVILGINGNNNGTWLSAFPQPPVGTEWRHWVWASKAKLINGKRFIGFCNSWGESVGDNGIQWIDEGYLPNIFVAWTLYIKSLNFQFTKDMMYGQLSTDIIQLQKRLGVIPASGYYGPLTKAAVFAYQKSHLSLSWYEQYILRGNVCGKRTRMALNKG